MVYFLRENEPVFVNLSLRGGPKTPPPPPPLPQCTHTVRIKWMKRYKQKFTQHNVYNNQPTTPSPFWLYWNLRSEVRNPPPPGKNFLGPRLQWVFLSVVLGWAIKAHMDLLNCVVYFILFAIKPFARLFFRQIIQLQLSLTKIIHCMYVMLVFRWVI